MYNDITGTEIPHNTKVKIMFLSRQDKKHFVSNEEHKYKIIGIPIDSTYIDSNTYNGLNDFKVTGSVDILEKTLSAIQEECYISNLEDSIYGLKDEYSVFLASFLDKKIRGTSLNNFEDVFNSIDNNILFSKDFSKVISFSPISIAIIRLDNYEDILSKGVFSNIDINETYTEYLERNILELERKPLIKKETLSNSFISLDIGLKQSTSNIKSEKRTFTNDVSKYIKNCFIYDEFVFFNFIKISFVLDFIFNNGFTLKPVQSIPKETETTLFKDFVAKKEIERIEDDYCFLELKEDRYRVFELSLLIDILIKKYDKSREEIECFVAALHNLKNKENMVYISKFKYNLDEKNINFKYILEINNLKNHLKLNDQNFAIKIKTFKEEN